MSQIREKIETLDIENAALWIAEADFGFGQVQVHIDALPKGASILEIGCGSGILLGMLAERYPTHSFFGMEPLGDGFSALEKLNTLVRETGVNIAPCGYETFSSSEKYDLIFCVNVFEHVPDWRNLLEWVSSALRDGGTFIALCPNYTFPYESHFKIPILLNKTVTRSIFHRHIERFESQCNAHGLWDSLNFVKKREVKQFMAGNPEMGLTLSDDVAIIDDMTSRITHDPEFRKRQPLLGQIARVARAVGILGAAKFFRNYLPYMKLSFHKI